jgi:anti-sigma regulatory factor (Ser/Thr protein kinase)
MDDSIDLPCLASQVATARRFVGGQLTDCPLWDSAVLIVSELATNVVRYSPARNGGKFTVRVETEPGWARIEVSTDGREEWDAKAAMSDESAESGRGLGIVYNLSSNMGHSWDGERDTVWAELQWATSSDEVPAPDRSEL